MKPAPGLAPLPRQEQQFGAVAVRLGFISGERLREALALQRNLQACGTLAVKLGELLVGRGWISAAQAAMVRKIQSAAENILEIPGYRIHEEIGRGQSGRVLRGTQLSMDRVVALKLLHSSHAENAETVARFVREARVVAKLSHPNVVQGIDVGFAGGVHYFVMEFVEGPPLRGLIHPGRSMDERYALGVATQVARALQHAHENGLVHRDVKPGNILIGRDGAAKLADLGLAAGIGSGKGGLTGSPAYMSPEQARGADDVDIRSDVYSLGASLFHMLTGAPPFSGETVSDILAQHLYEAPRMACHVAPGVSTATSQAIDAALRKDREKRFRTPAEFAVALEHCAWALFHAAPTPVPSILAPDTRPRFAHRRQRRI